MLPAAKTKHRRDFSLRCTTVLPFAAWFVVNPLKSIRAQQNGADEHKHGAHHEHIKLQGKVHDCDSLSECDRAKLSALRGGATPPAVMMHRNVSHLTCSRGMSRPKRLIAQSKIFSLAALRIATAPSGSKSL